MNILICDPADFFGGAEGYTIDILRVLTKKTEHNITLLTTGKSDEYQKNIPKTVKVIRMDIPRLRPFRPIAFLTTLLYMRTILRTQKWDIIHSNSVRAGIFFSMFAKQYCWTHSAHDFTMPKWTSGFFRRAKGIFACSHAVKKDLIRKGVPGKKIYVVPNGLPLDTHAPLPFSKKEKTIVALVGRIDGWKGQDVFLRAAELLKDELPDVEFRLYGTANTHDKKTQAYEKTLRAMAKQLPNVRFCGHEKRENIFSDITLLVHASTQPEPFGRTVLEALFFGVPVIASDDGGVREILAGEEFSDFRITPNNPHALAKKILFLLRNPKKQEEFWHLAEQRKKAFDLQKIVNTMEKIWKQCYKHRKSKKSQKQPDASAR